MNVGLLLDAAGEHVVERGGGRVLDGHAAAGHHAEHSKDIQHGLVDAVGGKVAKAVEIGLVLKLEGPGDGAEEIHPVFGGQVQVARHDGGGVAGVHHAVAVGVLGIDARRTGGAALRIGLADDDGTSLQLGVGGDDFEALGQVAKLILDAHDHAALGEFGRAFGVEADEIERRAGLAGRIVLAVQGVLEEVAQEGRGADAGGAGGVRAADAG